MEILKGLVLSVAVADIGECAKLMAVTEILDVVVSVSVEDIFVIGTVSLDCIDVPVVIIDAVIAFTVDTLVVKGAEIKMGIGAV